MFGFSHVLQAQEKKGDPHDAIRHGSLWSEK